MSPGHGRASYSDTPTETPPSASAHLTSGRDLASEPSVSSLHSAFSGMTLTDHLKGRLHLGSEFIRNDTPSETSISDDEEDLRTDEVDEGLRRWASKRKGKDKAQEEEREEGLAADLPAEVLMQVGLLWRHVMVEKAENRSFVCCRNQVIYIPRYRSRDNGVSLDSPYFGPDPHSLPRLSSRNSLESYSHPTRLYHTLLKYDV